MHHNLSKTPQDIIAAVSHHELEVPPSNFFIQKVLRTCTIHYVHSASRWLQPFPKNLWHMGHLPTHATFKHPRTLLTFTLRATAKYLLLPVIGRSPRLWRLALKKNWLDLGRRTTPTDHTVMGEGHSAIDTTVHYRRVKPAVCTFFVPRGNVNRDNSGWTSSLTLLRL